jgi:hypothetical protein
MISPPPHGVAMGYYDAAPPGLFGNMWVMGANVVFQTPEGSHRKAHSIAMGLDCWEPFVWFAYFLLFHCAFGFGD